MFDLPYFNPVIFTVVENMHAIDLGLLQNHIHDIFQIDLKQVGRDGYFDPPLPKQYKADNSSIRKCMIMLWKNAEGLLYKLLSIHRKVLYLVCELFNIKAEGHNLIVGMCWILTGNLFRWVSVYKSINHFKNKLNSAQPDSETKS